MSLEKIAKEIAARGITELHAYSRKSRPTQDEETLKKHRDALVDCAEKLELPVILHEEIDTSETIFKPVIQDVIQKIKEKSIRCLLVFRNDRLSRKTTDLERLMAVFDHHDLLLIEVHQMNIVNYADVTKLKMTAIISDLFLDHIKDILAQGRRNGVILYGKNIGPRILGYNIDPHEKILVIRAEEARIVKLIFNSYLSGMSTHEITIMLNQKGYKNSLGKDFKCKGVWDTLQNEKYIGSQVYGKTKWSRDFNGKQISKDVPREDWVVRENSHEAIISIELFDEVRRMLKKRSAVPKAARRKRYSLSNVIRCGRCNSHMTFVKGKKKTYLRACNNRDYLTGDRCGNYGDGIPIEDLENYILKSVLNYVKPALLKLAEISAQNGPLKQLNGSSSKRLELEKEANQLNKDIEKLIEIQLNAEKPERYQKKIDSFERTLEDVKMELLALEDERFEKVTWATVFLERVRGIDMFPLVIKTGSNKEKNIAIKKYVESVIYTKGQPFEIVYTKEIQIALEQYEDLMMVSKKTGTSI